MSERPNKTMISTKHTMNEVLERILTEKAARDSNVVTVLAVSQEEFDTWN